MTLTYKQTPGRLTADTRRHTQTGIKGYRIEVDGFNHVKNAEPLSLREITQTAGKLTADPSSLWRASPRQAPHRRTQTGIKVYRIEVDGLNQVKSSEPLRALRVIKQKAGKLATPVK